MKTANEKRNFLRAILSGNRDQAKKLMRAGIEFPLYWERDGNRYVAGDIDVSEAEFVMISKIQTCFSNDET